MNLSQQDRTLNLGDHQMVGDLDEHGQENMGQAT